ncbi:putative necrosis-inducing factor-domain-containing protein [Annulohypoxylon bovei var. microspora]|nr:putative necrosis-inducing factor-domain-containing protein [Annulohypoxylon bovei var. microspora]
MYLSTFTITIFLVVSNLAKAIQLPGINGSFVEHQVQHPNGSIVSVYVRDSYKSPPSSSSIDSLDKRFYEIYHYNTEPEICAETNFVGNSTPDSALCSDCSVIITRLTSNWGFFETGDYKNSEYNYLTTSGTCTFAVRRTDGLNLPVNIGSKDVIDNLNVSLIRFSSDDHVGATGNFTCGSSLMNWAILRRV